MIPNRSAMHKGLWVVSPLGNPAVSVSWILLPLLYFILLFHFIIYFLTAALSVRELKSKSSYFLRKRYLEPKYMNPEFHQSTVNIEEERHLYKS